MNVYNYSLKLTAAIAKHGDPICRTTDPDAWFPDSTEGSAKPARDARAMCAACPVMAQCRDYAIANKERHGIWGGLDARQRATFIASKKRSMRDRKAKEATATSL